MTTTLFTFLGRVPTSESGYRKTSYAFGDGSASEPVAFFGWALQRRIKTERLVVMGTAGSMWDHIFEGDINFGQEHQDARIHLIDAAKAKQVARSLLAPLEKPLSDRLHCEVRLILIPYCRTEQEQVELLRIMAEHVDVDDTVHIDVSHGFRHLPMIALLAALHLRATRKANIGGIWYGAFDPDTNKATVHNLVGLLRIADWLEALHTYDKDGDYSAFAPFLGPAGDLLAQGAFFERTSNPVKAAEKLSSWTRRADRFPSSDPAVDLFRDELQQRVSWHLQPDRAAREKELAERYLEQGDYVRAAIYGLESVVSREISASAGEADDFQQRDETRKDLLRSGLEGFSTLSQVRNALAHTARPSFRIQQMVKDEASLRSTLKGLLKQLLDR